MPQSRLIKIIIAQQKTKKNDEKAGDSRGLAKYIKNWHKFDLSRGKKMGAELNEMAFHQFISSITNTIWYIDVQKYQSWRKLGQLRSVGKNYFLCHVLTI